MGLRPSAACNCEVAGSGRQICNLATAAETLRPWWCAPKLGTVRYRTSHSPCHLFGLRPFASICTRTGTQDTILRRQRSYQVACHSRRSACVTAMSELMHAIRNVQYAPSNGSRTHQDAAHAPSSRKGFDGSVGRGNDARSNTFALRSQQQSPSPYPASTRVDDGCKGSPFGQL